MSESVVKGTVKMFNKDKGFGFITTEKGEDVFFHFSALNMEGYKTVDQGRAVEFTLEQSDRGPRAININLL